MSVEELAKQIFDECAKDGEPVTREEALEMANMEIGAKGMVRGSKIREPGEKTEKKPKTVKVSDEKKAIFETILRNLDRCEYIDRKNISVLTENKLILVEINGKKFKIDLIESRK